LQSDFNKATGALGIQIMEVSGFLHLVKRQEALDLIKLRKQRTQKAAQTRLRNQQERKLIERNAKKQEKLRQELVQRELVKDKMQQRLALKRKQVCSSGIC
jgi:hypothetical protein